MSGCASSRQPASGRGSVCAQCSSSADSATGDVSASAATSRALKARQSVSTPIAGSLRPERRHAVSAQPSRGRFGARDAPGRLPRLRAHLSGTEDDELGPLSSLLSRHRSEWACEPRPSECGWTQGLPRGRCRSQATHPAILTWRGVCFVRKAVGGAAKGADAEQAQGAGMAGPRIGRTSFSATESMVVQHQAIMVAPMRALLWLTSFLETLGWEHATAWAPLPRSK